MVLHKRTALSLLALLALLWLAGCGTNASLKPTSIPQNGLSSRPISTSTNPEHETDNKSHPAPGLHTESIVVANGQAYVGSDNGQLYVFDTSHGKIRWHHSGQATHLFAVDGNTLYAGNDANHIFYALDASNGAELWQRTLNVEFNVVKVVNGIVYVDALSGTSPSTIYALRATNGALLWQYAVASSTPSLVAVSQGRVYDIPSDLNSPGTPTTVTVLDATSGHVLWQMTSRASDGAFGGSGIAESNGVVYLSTTQGSVYAVQEASGVLLWHTSQPASKSFYPTTTPVIMDGVVYAGTSSAIFAYQTSTGHVLWQYHTRQIGPSMSIQPLAGQGTIYFAASLPQGELVALRASNGQVLWQHTLISSSGIDAWLLLNGLIINQIGDVAAWGTSDGNLVWSHNTDNHLSPPGPGRSAFTDTSTGTLYIGGRDGSLQALRLSDGKQLWTYQIQEKPVQQETITNASISNEAS